MATSKEFKSRGGLVAVRALALSALGIASAHAGSTAGNMTGPDVTVRYSDLDIDTESGATALLKRIKVAAGSVCASLNHGDIASRANVDKCNAQLTDAAVTKVNHPVLASIHKSTHRNASSVAALAE
ncbi:MAG: UrcA family protein [Pseudomonadota bacterium]